MTKEKQDLINIYREYKKYKSENLFSLLYYHLSKYLTSLNILNKRTNDYEITFYINNKEYKDLLQNDMYHIDFEDKKEKCNRLVKALENSLN